MLTRRVGWRSFGTFGTFSIHFRVLSINIEGQVPHLPTWWYTDTLVRTCIRRLAAAIIASHIVPRASPTTAECLDLNATHDVRVLERNCEGSGLPLMKEKPVGWSGLRSACHWQDGTRLDP